MLGSFLLSLYRCQGCCIPQQNYYPCPNWFGTGPGFWRLNHLTHPQYLLLGKFVVLFGGVVREHPFFHAVAVLLKIVVTGEQDKCLDGKEECRTFMPYMSILGGVAKHWLNYLIPTRMMVFFFLPPVG